MVLSRELLESYFCMSLNAASRELVSALMSALPLLPSASTTAEMHKLISFFQIAAKSR